MPLQPLRALSLALVLAAVCRGSGPAPGGASTAQEPSVGTVRTALRVFDSLACGQLDGNPSARPDAPASDALAAATRSLVRFALASDRIVVDLGPDAVTWCGVRNGFPDTARSGERGLLLTAYVAGEIRAQLDAGRADPNPYPGWIHMLRLYHTLQLRDGVAIPEIDALQNRMRAGSLAAYAAEAERRSMDRLRQAYGEPARQPGQPSLVQAPP